MSFKNGLLAAGLGITFLAVSYLRIWGDTGSALFSSDVLEIVTDAPLWKTALGEHVFIFSLTQLLIHIGLGLGCLGIAHISKFAWPKLPLSVRTWLLLWFLMSIAWLIVANATLFHWSSAATTHIELFGIDQRSIHLYHATSTVFLMSIVLTLLAAIQQLAYISYINLPPLIISITGAIILGSLLVVGLPSTATTYRIDSTSKPNIIFIGLDSFRVDRILQGNSLTPNISRFLDNSTVLTDTTTPLPRTFPAWISILSGQHPHTTGAYENLLPRDLIATSGMLPEMLQKAGYRSIYATDESRFSNLDEIYGFNEIVSPPMGAADFLLSFFSDTPLSNLLTNTTLGEFLFPWTYANRAATITYQPDTFIARLDKTLKINGPTFLAVHLTLAHIPYAWSNSPPVDDEEAYSVAQYNQAIVELDKQFDALMTVLKRHSLLEDAIVFVFSDHGESLGETPLSQYSFAQTLETPINEVSLFGHGSSVFADDEYSVVLGIRSFGTSLIPTRPGLVIRSPASLEDITPTIVDALSLAHTPPFDGISILPLLQEAPLSKEEAIEERIRFRETGFSPTGATFEELTAFGSELESASSFYKVDSKTGRVQMRPELLDRVLSDRQYAALQGNYMLASLPSADSDSQTLLAVNKTEGMARVLSEPPISDPEMSELWDALKERFEVVRTRSVANTW